MPATNQAWHPKQLICATSLDPDSAWIAAYAYRLAQQHQAEFLLFNVENPAQTKQSSDWISFEKAFKKCLPDSVTPANPLRIILSDNYPEFKIVEAAKECRADLIVMGARTTSAIATHSVPGTVPRVFTEAPCPVMTLHQS
jgi:nucleotide-binding universal stress UspA family protein